jgi:hypothetical protein
MDGWIDDFGAFDVSCSNVPTDTFYIEAPSSKLASLTHCCMTTCLLNGRGDFGLTDEHYENHLKNKMQSFSISNINLRER